MILNFQCLQHQGAQPSNGNKYISFEYKSGMDNGRTASSSDHESQLVFFGLFFLHLHIENA